MARRYSLRLHFRRRDTGHCDPDRPEVLPLRLLPHWQPSSECPRVGLHLKWRDDTPFGYILDGAIRGIAIQIARKSSHFAFCPIGNPPQNAPELGYILNGATILPSVTF